MASSYATLIAVLIAGLLVGYGISIFQGGTSPLGISEPRGPEGSVTITGTVIVARGEYAPSRVDFQSSNISSSGIVTNIAGDGTPSEPYTGRYSIFLPGDRVSSYEITIAYQGTSKLLETCSAGFVYLTVEKSSTELNLIC